MSDDSNYGRMLAACYELEGLLTLALGRRETTPPAVNGMIDNKIKLLVELGRKEAAVRSRVKPDDIDYPDVPEFKGGIDEEAVAESAEFEETEDAVDAIPEVPVVEAEVKTVVVEEKPAEAPAKPVRPAVAQQPSEPVFVFTLNDRFRFKRELFGGSDADFVDALHVAEAMSSKEEVEDYFYNDLCWDPDNQEVVDFMNIITARFK